MEQSQRLRQAETAWSQFLKELSDDQQSSQAADPISSAVPGWLFDCANRLELAETSRSADPVMKDLVWPLVTSQIDQIEQLMIQRTQNGSPWFLANQRPRMVLGFLWEIRKLLNAIFPEVRDPAMLPSVGEVVANAQRVHDLTRQAQQSLEAISKAEATSTSVASQVNDALTRIQGHEREASNAQTNAAGSAASANTSKQTVDDLVTALNDDVGTQKSLINEFTTNRNLVEETLQGASKIGLAKSFSARRRALETSQRIWTYIFIAGLGFLFVGASTPLWLGKSDSGIGTLFQLVFPSIGSVSKSTEASVVDVVLGYVSHVLLLGPGIWLTWFAARKHGQLSRLAEDYAFKEASALAFVGYRAEMGEDKEMLDLLRKTAIDNFGANPVRVLSIDEPASPVHDALIRVLKKTSPDKLADVLKETIKVFKN